MKSKDKLIISKLLAIAEKQQKALNKLAQVGQADPETLQYLKSTWQTAALNSGVTESHTPEVSFTPGSQHDGVNIGESYVVKGAIPQKTRELFDKNFKNQVKTQKPELDGKVSTIYLDPVASHVTASSKRVIEKLISIAEKQQKIINKLAQTTNVESAQQALQQAVQETGAKGQYKVLEAGGGSVKIQCPLSLIGSPETRALKEKLHHLGAVIFVGV
jgi:DNA-directed RNA polymerase subunit F